MFFATCFCICEFNIARKLCKETFESWALSLLGPLPPGKTTAFLPFGVLGVLILLLTCTDLSPSVFVEAVSYTHLTLPTILRV